MVSEKFDVTGMTCAACQANVTKAVQKLDGVSQVDVNLLSGSMQVEFDEKKSSIKKIENAVKKIGYGASVVKENKSTTNNDSDDDEFVGRWKNIQQRQKNNLKVLRNRLIFSIILLIPLLYIAMGPMIGLPTFWFFEGSENAKVIQALLGHKSVKTTLTVYNSVDKSYYKQATDKLNDLFNSDKMKEYQELQNKKDIPALKREIEEQDEDEDDPEIEFLEKLLAEKKARKKNKDFEM